MKAPLRRLLAELSRDAAVYGAGGLAQSLLLFAALAAYARAFSREEYGVFTILLSFLAVGDIVARLGVHFAYVTLAHHHREPEDARRLAVTAWTMLLAQATLLLCGVAALLAATADWTTGGRDVRLEIALIATHLLCATPAVFLQFRLRSQDRPLPVIGIGLTQMTLAVTVGLALAIVAGGRVSGAIAGYVVASLLVGAVTGSRVLARLGLGIFPREARELYRLGLPFTIIHVVGTALQYSSRWSLMLSRSLGEVALFDVASRVGTVLAVLLVTPFSVAWTSRLFSVARSEEPQRAFAKLFSYLLLAMAWLGVGLSAFGREAAGLLGGRQYLAAAWMVPFLVTAMLLWGAYSFLSAGPALAKSWREPLAASGAALATNWGLNAALTPSVGLAGATFATLASSAVLVAVMFVGAQRLNPVEYEWRRLGKLALLYAPASALGVWLAEPTVASVASRGLLLLGFPLLLWLVGFFDPAELRAASLLGAQLLARRDPDAPPRPTE